jgi:broad specificity phosphatase PhoE
MLTLYLVRHGETKLNHDNDTSQDRIRGWSDVPLTDKGRKEAKVAAAKLKPHGIEVICCSDLSRAKETAEIIGKILGIKPTPSKKLRPWNLGDLTGTSTKDALPQIAKYVREKPKQKVPDGESFENFSDRAFEGFAESVKKANGKTLCIVSHHRDERLLTAWDKAGQPASHKIDLDVFLKKGDPPGGVLTYEIDEKKLLLRPKMSAGSTPEKGGGYDDPKNKRLIEALKYP